MIQNQLSFFDRTTRHDDLSPYGDPLKRVAAMVHWEDFSAPLAKALRRSKGHQTGHIPFDGTLMFKALVLQSLYQLSNVLVEYQVRDRLSFIRFLHLDQTGRIPEAKTIWLFHKILTQGEAVESLFPRFSAASGLMRALAK